jgi:hypothetical protein
MDGVCPSFSDLINKKCLIFFSKKKKKKKKIIFILEFMQCVKKELIMCIVITVSCSHCN